jgi:HAD superfamily hydrolase (TIGR01484 family)
VAGGPPVRLVATDLDGTLLRSDGTVAERTARAIAACEDAGILVLMVTGRPPRWMAAVRSVLGPHGIAVCQNGAVVYDLAADEVVRSSALVPEVAAQVVEALRARIPGARFAVEQAAGFGHEPGYPLRGARADAREAPLAELLTAPSTKIMLRSEGADPDELLAAVRDAVGPIATATRASPTPLIEISAAGVSKAVAVEELAAGWGITAAEAVASRCSRGPATPWPSPTPTPRSSPWPTR